jgi:predicted CXXCH cytochrome family protein
MLLPLRAWAVQDVVNTRHNLSSTEPVPPISRTFASATVSQVCVFCHTPHNATPEAPLWNRSLSTGQTYDPYDSSTLQASPKPDQPTGKSRLCLSCHDGTVALGALVNPPTGVVNDMAGTLLTGRGALGTDLKDDHPISFNYDSTLATADGELVDPANCCNPTVSGHLPLEGIELQCTSCHDAHEKDLAPFLRRTVLDGSLCTSCHDRKGPTLAWEWATSSHATSVATPSSTDPWANRRPEWQQFTNVGEGACLNCHTPHNAAFTPPRPPRLLKDHEENTCYLCHDGSVTTHAPPRNVQADFAKQFNHPVDITPNTSHDATLAEDPLTMSLHVECADCHNPHGVKDEPPMISFNPLNLSAPHTTPPNANARIKGVTGIDINGAVISYQPGSAKQEIDFQYELCFKCHGVPFKSSCGSAGGVFPNLGRCRTPDTLRMERVDGIYNIREKVDPGIAVSYHPLVQNNAANNLEMPSLVTPLLPTDLIYCTDCHSSNVSPAAGGVGPTGAHGSTWAAMLTQRYEFDPTTPFDQLNQGQRPYEVCYKCHSEASILADESFREHDLHVRGADKPCVLCHDPHGSHDFDRLLNFLTNITFGGQDWTINDDCGGGGGSCGRIGPTWEDAGTFSGACYLNCHDRDPTDRIFHDPFTY